MLHTKRTCYLITNHVNGKYYVGKTNGKLIYRWRVHLRDAERGSDIHFHRAIRKYGAENFTIETLPTGDDPLISEKLWIISLRAYDPLIGYNGTFGGDGLSNPTAATRKRMSAAHMGVKLGPHTAEHNDKISAGLVGHVVSSETLLKISKNRRGIPAWNKGMKRGPMSQEQKDKIGASNKGRVVTKETREKIGNKLLGNKNYMFRKWHPPVCII